MNLSGFLLKEKQNEPVRIKMRKIVLNDRFFDIVW